MPKPSTDSIHGHGYFDVETGAFKVPLYLTTIFEHPDKRTGESRKSDRGFEQKYSREENPTVRGFERVMAKLEGAKDSLAFGSGMAAISCVYLSSLKSGDTVVVSKESYGTTQDLALNLAKFGVKTVLAGPDTGDLRDKVKPGVSLVLLETITNPLVRVVDVPAIARRCREVGARLVVDNTFATPLLYRPLEGGAWLSVQSATKYIGGHNDVVGGTVALDDPNDLAQLWDFRRRMGSIMMPFESFLALRGAASLSARFRVQCGNALEMAKLLKDHPRVERVYYPGLRDDPYRKVADGIFREKGLYGGVLSFKVKGGRAKALGVLKKVELVKPSPSLGGTESLLNYPITSASRSISPSVKEELGISENLLRLSLGLEDAGDLWADLERALA
ncbi:MAG: cystathionine gamma-synthase family protein [Nitrososphaerota archaeon]|nr:cystathionine gamma-synthase family protein [Nitrososphaerota archaeon]MDG6978275.1 cystathionine gamma-synthase family protein [Nitrososphaerota archaeon]